MKRFPAALSLVLVILLPFACRQMETKDDKNPAPAPVAAAQAPYPAEIAHWQATRAANLRKDDSWLTLVGLYWLNEGENRFGSDRAANHVPLPAKAPASAGTFVLDKGAVTMNATAPVTIDGKPVSGPAALLPDSDPKGPTMVQLGTMRFHVIKRGDRYGIRVKDPESEARKNFQGLEYFPVDPKWRVEARFEPYDPPKKIPITNIIGITTDEVAPGALVFTLDGKTYRLDPILEQGETDLFIIFKDETSKDSTYPAGRYLYASPGGPDGKVIVDFNKAYNPPCAFTDFATCPLPPLQNRLPVRIEAGEQKYKGGHA